MTDATAAARWRAGILAAVLIAGGGGYGGSGASSPPLQPVPWPRSDLSPDPKETWDAVKPNEDTDNE